jgi:protein-disulfide isomerase
MMTSGGTIPRGRIPKKSGNGRFIALVAGLLVLGVIVLLFVLKGRPAAPVLVASNVPLPKAQGYVIGSDSAPVEILMVGDFECPGCGQFFLLTEPEVRSRLVATGKARYRFMDYLFPPSVHPSNIYAHNAAACANAQGKFWEMHDSLFTNQVSWSEFRNHRDMNPTKIFKRYAKQIGLDTKAFDGCLDTRQFEPQVRANMQYSQSLNVGSTPTLIIGKRMVPGTSYDVVKALVDSATAEAKLAPPAKATPVVEAGKKK